jgi:hypothetical protein
VRRLGPRKDAEPVQRETCTIRLARREGRGRFVAVDADGATVARSPIFRLDDPAGGEGYSAPDALDELIGELAAAGWRQSAKGKRPWDVRMQRPVEAPRTAEP